MITVSQDEVVPVGVGQSPNYDRDNPIDRLARSVESVELCADREHYINQSLEYLFSVEKIDLHGPAGENPSLDPKSQNNKEDFQKQNVRKFHLGDIQIVRGWVVAGDWKGPFLQISYRGGPDSRLSQISNHQLSGSIDVWLKLNDSEAIIQLPYNPRSDRYQAELWGANVDTLAVALGSKGLEALESGALLPRPDIASGNFEDFAREALDDQPMVSVAPNHILHPVLPLRLELAFKSGAAWDSRNGRNYTFEFSMLHRGWKRFLKTGFSRNPHGGHGFLEYRNLLSNYFEHKSRNELGRGPAPWSYDAFGSKEHHGRFEPFFAVDYMDHHIVKPNAAIGLHRHRDNQEVFLLMEGQALMAVGDWCEFSHRCRALEVRTMVAGDLTICKPGQLHGLYNLTDEDLALFMFGGYD